MQVAPLLQALFSLHSSLSKNNKMDVHLSVLDVLIFSLDCFHSCFTILNHNFFTVVYGLNPELER